MPVTPRVASLRQHAGIAKCHEGCGCGGTADAERSQRLGRKPVWVRLPPPARWLDSAPSPSIVCQCVVSALRDDSVTQKGRGATRGLCIAMSSNGAATSHTRAVSKVTSTTPDLLRYFRV